MPKHTKSGKPAKTPKPVKKPFPLTLVALIAVLSLATVGLYLFRFQANTSVREASNAKENAKESSHAEYEEPAVSKDVVVIEITASGFTPSEVEVKANTSIIAFRNTEKRANVIIAEQKDASGKPLFNTGKIKPRRQISAIEFSEPGTYTYYNEARPDEKGTITVTK